MRLCTNSAALSLVLVSGLFAQNANRHVPERGLRDTGSFTISDIETIDNVTGNVSLTIPIASLPPGPTGFTHGVSLVYHSALYDIDATTSALINGNKKILHKLTPKADEVWNYGFLYGFYVEKRDVDLTSDSRPNLCDVPEYQYGFRVWMTLPDGSRHATRLLPQSNLDATDNNGDGYFRYRPDGLAECNVAAFSGTMSYHTVDGTFLRLEHTGSTTPDGCVGTDLKSTFDGTQPLRWTIYLPDGRRAGGCSTAVGPGIVIEAQVVVDRNGNWIKVTRGSSGDAVTHTLIDQFNRSITINQPLNSAADTITWTGTGGQQLTATLQRGNTTVGGLGYRITDVDNAHLCDPTNSACLNDNDPLTLSPMPVPDVRYLVLPGGKAGDSRRFDFDYTSNCPANGNCWGELREVKYSSGATSNYTIQYTVRYSYRWDNAARGDGNTDPVDNPVKQKLFCPQGDCTTSPETTTYSIDDEQSTITAPDGSQIIRHYNHRRMASDPLRGLVKKTRYPDQSVDYQVWSRNKPANVSDYEPANPYVSRSVHSVATGQQRSCATVDTTVDKNGNIRTRSEYEWITQDNTNDCPLTSPASDRLRKTEKVYAATTPDASEPPIAIQAYAYWNVGSAARYLLALKTTVISDSADRTISSRTFDYTQNSVDVSLTKANLTSETRWDDGPSTARSLTTAYEYTAKGDINKITKPGGGVITITYDANQLFPIKKSVGTLRNAQYCYEQSSGLLKQELDTDNKLGVEIQYDSLGRQTKVKEVTFSTIPVPGDCVTSPGTARQTEFVFDDGARRVTRKQDLAAAADSAILEATTFDAHGRPSLVQTPSEGGVTITQTREYKYGSGSTWEIVSNPQRPASDATAGWTVTRRDFLGRVTEVSFYAGTTNPWQDLSQNLTGKLTTSYSGRSAKTTEAGRSREAISDALGRVTEVIEADDSSSSIKYTYDPLDNLTTVTHTGTVAPAAPLPSCDVSNPKLSRKFAYTSLGQLKSACNPESGTALYSYDKDGNLQSRTDARGVITCYGALSGSSCTAGYDALGRPSQKTYSDSTSAVSFSYDTSAYGKGRLAAVAVTAGSSVLYDEYDALGRVTKHRQKSAIPTIAEYAFEYTYNKQGLTGIKYPSGRQVSYDIDSSSGRVTGVKAGASDYYMRNVGYSAAGTFMTAKYEIKGAAPPTMIEERCFNPRNQATIMRIGSALSANGNCENATTDSLWLGYSYGIGVLNSGNIEAGTIKRNANSWLMSYTYDNRNRITSVSDTYAQTYLYDVNGNMAFDNTAGRTTYNPEGATFVPMAGSADDVPLIFKLNRWSGNQYYASGEVETTNGTSYQYSYDAEGRVISATTRTVTPNLTATYEYDGNGRRVRKTVSGLHWLYVYDVDGNLAAEYPASGQPSPLTGRLYLMSDMLGSTRLTMRDTGVTDQCFDYTPFGSEITSSLRSNLPCYPAALPPRTGTPPPSDIKFTGKQRDAETGLDYFGARYMSAAQGRFTSPDPLLNSGRPWEPQSWNRYAYALNNPLKYVDPDGLWEWAPGDCDDQCQANRKRFRAAVELIRQSAKKDSSLNAVVKAIGKENEKTGLGVRFGSLEGNVGAAYNPQTGMMTVDFGRNDAMFASRPDLEGLGFSREVENASGILHEGTHHADKLAGYDFGIRVGGRNQARDLQRLFDAESRAYGNQILFHRTTDTRPLTFRELWNSSWSTVDQHTIDSAIGRKAQQSVDHVKKELRIK